jgi:hypothetical protein
MKRIRFLIFSVFVMLNPVFSQDKVNSDEKILFQGIVMDASSLMPIPNSQISINRAFSSVGGDNGTFAFFVNRKDTVLFRRMGYKSTTMFVSDTLTGRTFMAGIYMNSDTLAIGEVVILPKFSNLKSEIMNAKSNTPATFDNARYNVAVSAYAGKTTTGSLGTPSDNYALLKQQQKTAAYERGSIVPSDRMVSLNPFMIIPAVYMLAKGLPQRAAPFRPVITKEELDQLNKKYLETINGKIK